jgi:hypothetical protein
MAAIKLTKTERTVLDLAAQCVHGTISLAQPEGAPVSRKLRAIRSLRARGLLEPTNAFTEWDRRKGYVTLYDVTHDTITEAGRRALEVSS